MSRAIAIKRMRSIMNRRPILCYVDVSGSRRLGKVVKVNYSTTWVKIMKGAKTSFIIKRHNIKHNVGRGRLGEPYESVHTPVGD